MSILVQRIIPIISLTLALAVLCVLIAVSTSPAGETFRKVDSRVQYLRNVAQTLDQYLGSENSSSDETQVAAVSELAASLSPQVAQIRANLSGLSQPQGLADGFSWSATYVFNLIDRQPYGLADRTRYELPLNTLTSSADQVGRHIDLYQQNSSEFEQGLLTFRQNTRSLVQSLRATGRDDLADQIFRAGDQIHADIVSGEPARLTRVGSILERAQIVVDGLGSDEQSTGRELLEIVPVMVAARRAMNQALKQMDLPGLANAVARFSEVTNEDQVRTLSMISDARVLLNLYTIFLLGLLAYLGLRLRASYSALNRSHDDLEVRVHERTADLELAYEELKESQVQLVQAEKMSSLGQLVAGVMHEINTPLLYVLNNASVTSDSIADVDRFVQSALPLLEAQGGEDIKTALKTLLAQRAEFDVESIRESAEEVATLNRESIEGLHQISDLVQSLKDFSRLDRATEDRFDVCEGIEKTLTITKNLLKYGIEVERNFESVGEIFCSPARINQIFVNLVTNAAQAMDGEGKLRISVRAVDDGVEIAFEDTGCGIAEDDLNRIMDPFFTTKPVGQGTGLGLSIVHQIVQQHQGHLDVRSEVGKGTRIAVRLPRQPYSEEAA